jgi:hypothetical protein
LFTPDFRKLRVVAASVGCVLVLYASLNVGLMEFAGWTERRFSSYPWPSEDYLRVLLRSLYENRGEDRILLAGPSEAREDLLYERFDREFPSMRAYQGAQSLGTLDDLLLALEYIEKVHGRAAVPASLVLGITPRFVANIPPGVSPLAVALNRYSSSYRVESGPLGSRLVPKSWRQSLIARARFLLKQPSRYLSALGALGERALVAVAPPGRAAAVTAALRRSVARHASPYKYHHLERMPPDILRGWLQDPSSFWFKVHGWDPSADGHLVRVQLERLRAVARRHGIRLFVVNLPEHRWNREGYRPGRYEAYMSLVRASLDGTPFLDLRELLEPEEFYDVGHATLAGATRVTERVVEFIKVHDGVAAR